MPNFSSAKRRAFFILIFLINMQVLSGKYVLRFAVGAPLTEEKHVNAGWSVLQEKASALLDP